MTTDTTTKVETGVEILQLLSELLMLRHLNDVNDMLNQHGLKTLADLVVLIDDIDDPMLSYGLNARLLWVNRTALGLIASKAADYTGQSEPF